MQEKHVMGMTGKRSFGVILCSFCARIQAYENEQDCPHYCNDYINNQCTGFVYSREAEAQLVRLLTEDGE